MTTWLEPETVAALLPSRPSPRHVRRLAAAKGWQTRRVKRNGNATSLQIALESLSAEERANYHATHAAVAQEKSPAPRRSFLLAGKDAQVRAEARQRAVHGYERFLAEWGTRKGLTLAERRWLAEYSSQNAKDLEVISISISSLKRWLSAYTNGGRQIDVLVDGNDGSSRRGRTSIPDQILGEFKAIYLRAAKPSVAVCYKRLKKVAKARGWELPGYDTFRYYANHILPRSVASYFREPDQRRENLRPFISRDYDDPDFRAMQIIQSDHHQIDVAVSCGDPFCLVGHYPWITVWIDLRSRKVLAVEVYIETPNSRRILKLLYRVLVVHGVPQYVYVDNGADYVKAVGRWSVKHFDVGRRSAKNVEVAGWTPDMVERIAGPFEMEAIFSTEGNPQSKLIERWFLTLKEALYTLFDSYRGALGERSERAEYLRKHPEQLPAIGALTLEVERTVEEYNAAPHRGDGMHGRSPNEVFAATRLPFREADRAALAVAFWTEKVGAKVQRQGIKHQHNWYALPAEPFVQYFDAKVNFRYDEDAPETIAVYDAAWRFIAIATTRGKAPQHRGDERVAKSIEELQREWNLVQSLIREHNPAAGKHLENIAAGVEDYYRLQARESGSTALAAASGAGASVVTVVDSYLSPLARQIQSARERLEAGAGPRLTAEQLELAATAEDHSEEFLDLIAPPRPFLVTAPPAIDGDDEDDDPILFAAELKRVQRLHAQREQPTCSDCAAGDCVLHDRLEE